MKHTTYLCDFIFSPVLANNCNLYYLPHAVLTYSSVEHCLLLWWCISCVAAWDFNQTAAAFSTLTSTRSFLTVRMLLHAYGTGNFCENPTVKRELHWLVKAPVTVNFLLNKKIWFYTFFLQNTWWRKRSQCFRFLVAVFLNRNWHFTAIVSRQSNGKDF